MRQQSGSTLKGIDAGELLTSDVVTSDTMVVDDANSDDNHTVEASNDSSEGGSTSSVDASNATTIPANTVISTSPMTTTTKTSDGIDVPSPKRARASIHGAPTREMAGAPRRSRARRVASVVAQTTATVAIGAVAAWTALAFT
ncbi:hypothetical protein K435DRAFT_775997 [Dendrothele bispora CBS 962.96]|uniref:Uncharacterized protein n=1 Tax=Dendrothele bispora (strain CBS 962.96) TaxID=1314807 RepID=A0A4S8MFR8_DENBC|nr:hypothetical protein K435DRAFT_775997 [Dendrothele bispora CBS 962.96]